MFVKFSCLPFHIFIITFPPLFINLIAQQQERKRLSLIDKKDAFITYQSTAEPLLGKC